jgi:predicted MPP superfamily phosphohydrolase
MLALMRRLLEPFAVLGAILIILWGWGYHNARADPIVRQTRIGLPNWPRGAAPIRVALFSDIHIGSAAMDGARLSRIVAQVNALKPDLVLIAGDFVNGHDPVAARAYALEFVAPLASLRAPLGVVATLGNHDMGTSPEAVTAALDRAHVTVLNNQAVQKGPVVVAGVGDVFSRHARPAATEAAMVHMVGARIMLSHSPDIAPRTPPDITLLLAGHTHCGQIVLPLLGPVSKVAMDRYICGIVHEPGLTTIVTGGLGTSGVPLRYGAPPDLWLITLGPG